MSSTHPQQQPCNAAHLAIIETHPIQYRAPVYQALNKLIPDQFCVFFASDFSIRGYKDKEFGVDVSWDVPLLHGYRYEVLHSVVSSGLSGYRSAGGSGLVKRLRQVKPSVILLNSFSYEYCMKAYCWALLTRTPIWIRMETQDGVFARNWAKTIIRAMAYRILYSPVSRFFAVGNANALHYSRHGVSLSKIRRANYCTPSQATDYTEDDLRCQYGRVRASLGVSHDTKLVSFFGKLIPKKDPAILQVAVRLLKDKGHKIHLLYIGDGELRSSLESSVDFTSGITFLGFVNQSEIAKYYIASDIVVLPSRKMGETWGLVINEALDVGCACVTSDVVGCSQDFFDLERFRSFPSGNVNELAAAIESLLPFQRDFTWARNRMEAYSVSAAAKSIASEFERISQSV